jgi:hypothetical protein
MKSLIFPDVNVWLALNFNKHVHNTTAVRWYEAQSDSTFVFCRHTQLGLFRLLSTEVVMQPDTLNQEQCWRVFDEWINSGEAILAGEPDGLDADLRLRTTEKIATPKVWADAYLAAFAETARLTLVTFDKALAEKAKGAVLLS